MAKILSKTKQVVINGCYGGFSLSPLAVKRLAELQGRPCYFFKTNMGKNNYTPTNVMDSGLFVNAFDIPNPTDEDWKEHHITNRPEVRHDPLLIQVVEELKTKANGSCASLYIVKIPDDVEYVIEEYDGIESVAEAHRSWS